MNITKRHLKNFRNVIDKYQDSTEYPVKNNWQGKTNDELWLWLVGQVNVVGGVAGNDRFLKRDDLKKKISYSTLKRYNDDSKLQIVINEVLREAGIRYASSEISKCLKSQALVHNFRYISTYEGGFKGILKYLSEFNSDYAEIERVSFLIQHFKFIKNKSARDFLMSMGINRGTLALDVRIQNIFKHFEIDFPTQSKLSQALIYDETEKEIIEKVCEPLKIEAVIFDRILFQNYKMIILES